MTATIIVYRWTQTGLQNYKPQSHVKTEFTQYKTDLYCTAMVI